MSSAATIETIDIPRDGRAWSVKSVFEQGPMLLVEFGLEGVSAGAWEELITIRHLFGVTGAEPAGMARDTETAIRASVLNGTVTWSAREESADSVTYEWECRDDFAKLDQFEMVRVFRGETGVHSLHYACRRPAAVDGPARAAWRERLARAKLIRAERHRSPISEEQQRAGNEQVQSWVSDVERAGAARDQAEVVSICRRALGHPALYARPDYFVIFQYLLGSTLLTMAGRQPTVKPLEEQVADRPGRWEMSWVGGEADEDLTEQGFEALRLAHDPPILQQMTDLYPRALAALGRAYRQRARGERPANLNQALTAYFVAIRAVDRRAQPAVWAELLHELGVTYAAGGRDQAGLQLDRAVNALEAALIIRERSVAPLEWAESTCMLARTLHRLGETEAHRERAASLYQDVAEAVTLGSDFLAHTTGAGGAFDPDSPVTRILFYAVQSLRDLMVESLGAAAHPELQTREHRAAVMFLRPLTTARTFMIQNRTDKSADRLAVRFTREPETISLEAALYRALSMDLMFLSLGGVPDPLTSRTFLLGDEWKPIVEINLSLCKLIMFVPLDRQGMEWELEYLIAKNVLGKCVFVSPPRLTGANSVEVWASGGALMRRHGLSYPTPSDDGVFFRLAADGSIAEQWGFGPVWDGTLIERLEPLLAAAD